MVMNRRAMLAGVAAALVGAMTVVTSEAFVSPRANNLTFSGRVALPGVELPAGTYRFEVLTPGVGTNIVRVSSGRRVLYTGITLTVRRPRSMKPGQLIVFGEAALGEAPPIREWHPLNETTGHEFIYPR
jgi:hypothetical protein